MSAGAPLEFYFDFSSPYGYLAAQRIEAIGAEFGRAVVWRPYLLGVAFKTTGQKPLLEQPLRGPYSLRDMQRSARRMKVPFRLPEGFPMMTVAAARAFYWLEAQSPKRAKDLALALFDAAFAQGRNIQSAESVADIAVGLGLDRDRLLAGVNTPAIKERLRRETDHAIERGIFGSPFVIVDDEPFWGNDRLEDVREWLKTGGW